MTNDWIYLGQLQCNIMTNTTPTLQLLSEHGEEDGEVDGAAGLLDHRLQLLILHVQLAWTAQTFGLVQGTIKNTFRRHVGFFHCRFIPPLLTHWSQHVPEVIFADDTISVLVNDCESLRRRREAALGLLFEGSTSDRRMGWDLFTLWGDSSVNSLSINVWILCQRILC